MIQESVSQTAVASLSSHRLAQYLLAAATLQYECKTAPLTHLDITQESEHVSLDIIFVCFYPVA